MDKSVSPNYGGQITMIGVGTKITGNIKTSEDLRIDGELNGEINTTAKLIVGNSGIVNGKIKCESSSISGVVDSPELDTNQLVVKRDGKISGTVKTKDLNIENGAKFNASCQMKQ